MDDRTAATLLERLGCSRIKLLGDEMMCSCPFPDGHRRGDRRSSFSAHIDASDRSPYICYGCHARGTLEGLAVSRGHGDLVPDWKPKKIEASDWYHIPSTNAGIFSHACKEKKRPVLFRDDYLKPFLGRLSNHLIRRGITLDTAREWELGVDHENKRAIFTVRDYEGRLAAVIGRDVTDRSKVKYSNYVLDTFNGRMVPFIDHEREEDFRSPTKSFFLYGEFHAYKFLKGEAERPLAIDRPHLIVVEGPTDVLHLWQMGWNVVAALGSYPSEMQAEKAVTLLPRGGKVVIMGDGDEAGRKFAKALGEKIGERCPTFNGILPDGVDPGDSDNKLIEEVFDTAQMFSLTPH